MIKCQEEVEPHSCFNRANPDEMVFVLLARDPAAPVAIRAWIEERIRIGKNKREDGQIIEAEKCIEIMQNQSRKK